MTTLEPIKTQDQMNAVRDGLINDGGAMPLPSHVVYGDRGVVGAVSLGVIPSVYWWFDKERGNALQSVRAIKQSEDVMRSMGVREYQVVCPNDSTFYSKLDRLGFVSPFLGEQTIFTKTIGG